MTGRSLLLALLVCVSCFSLLVAPASAKPGGGNSAAAQACQGGFKNLVRADGSGFANTAACHAYVNGGGVPVSATPVLDIEFVMLDVDTYTYAVKGAGLQPGSLVTIEIAELPGGIFLYDAEATAGGTVPSAAGFSEAVDCGVNIAYKAEAITVYGDLIEAGGLEHLPPC
jgi:hypothetical protein